MYQKSPIANPEIKAPAKPRRKRTLVPKVILDALRKSQSQNIDGCGPIIRIFAKTPKGMQAFCPVTWLYYLKTKKYLPIVEWIPAAIELGLNLSEMIPVAAAADGCHEGDCVK